METGRDRVRAFLTRRPGEEFMMEEVKEFQATVLVATFTGFLLGGLVGARYSGDKFVRISQSAKFSSKMQAQRELHSASFLGFVSNGCRWGWKLGVFSAMFSGTNIIMSVYRDKSDAINYFMAGAVSGCLFRLPSGVKPAIGGLVLGTLLSVPVGIIMHGLERAMISQELREDTRRKKYELYRLKKEQWMKRLESTDRLIEGLQQELEEAVTCDSKTIDSQQSDGGHS